MDTSIEAITATSELKARVESDQLIDYLLHLADNALILGHRNSEWCGHGPILELDIAITNIALDLIGQARHFYQYAAELINQPDVTNRKASPMGGGLEGATEDALAFLRDAKDFKNCLLVEQPNGDWGVTVMRQFFFSTWQYYLYQHLQNSNDKRIAAIAAKALKEVTYHVRWSSEWVIRLGRGTEESNAKMTNAVDVLNQYSGELFTPADYENVAVREGYGADLCTIKHLWVQKVKETFQDATLAFLLPSNDHILQLFGKIGEHTTHLYELLTEMQFLQRTYPGAQW